MLGAWLANRCTQEIYNFTSCCFGGMLDTFQKRQQGRLLFGCTCKWRHGVLLLLLLLQG